MWFDYHADNAMSLARVAKNGGAFKSERQAIFFAKQSEGVNREMFEKSTGVPVRDEECVILVEGMAQFCSYGTRSRRRYGKAYIFDLDGIKSVWAVKYYGEERGGSPNPERTKRELLIREQIGRTYEEHLEEVERKRQERQEELIASGNIVTEGKQEIVGKIMSLKYSPVQAGYNNYVYYPKIVVIAENGNRFFGTLPKKLEAALYEFWVFQTLKKQTSRNWMFVLSSMRTFNQAKKT